MQRRQACTSMGGVIVSHWCCRWKDAELCAHAHEQLNVSAVTAHMHARPKLAWTREISSKTAIIPVCGIVVIHPLRSALMGEGIP